MWNLQNLWRMMGKTGHTVTGLVLALAGVGLLYAALIWIGSTEGAKRQDWRIWAGLAVYFTIKWAIESIVGAVKQQSVSIERTTAAIKSLEQTLLVIADRARR